MAYDPEERERMIYSLVTVNNVTSIEEIANHCEMEYKKAHKFIREMIDEATHAGSSCVLFKNAKIDSIKKEIILEPGRNR